MKRRPGLLALSLVAWSACSGADGHEAPAPAPSAVVPDITGVSYGPGATDEGLLALLDARPVDSSMDMPVVTAPEDRSTLGAPTTFAFRPNARALLRHRTGVSVRQRTLLDLADLFTLERSAYAHGAPMNGEAFLLVFSTSHEAHWLRVFLQGRSYTPSDAEWGRLAGAHEPLSLTVTRAVFEEGRLASEGGPFVGEPLHFTIASP